MTNAELDKAALDEMWNRYRGGWTQIMSRDVEDAMRKTMQYAFIKVRIAWSAMWDAVEAAAPLFPGAFVRWVRRLNHRFNRWVWTR